jgi:hypothetical protein
MWRCFIVSFFLVSYTFWTSAIMPSRFISVVKFRFSLPILGGDRLIFSLPSGPFLLLLIIYLIKSLARIGLFSFGGDGDFLILALLSIKSPLTGLTFILLLGSSGDLEVFLIIFITLLLSEIFFGSCLLTSVLPFGFRLTRLAFKILRF